MEDAEQYSGDREAHPGFDEQDSEVLAGDRVVAARLLFGSCHYILSELLPRFDHFLDRPDMHLGIDPEFMMKTGHVPGSKIGTIDASDINYATEHLARIVRDHDLPPKILVIHRFTRGMVTNSQDIVLRPEVQIVMHMDGWGAPWLKRDSYKDYIVSEPVQYAGFKLFYHNDTKAGDPLMTAEEVLRLAPRPVYIQYQ